MPLVQKTLTLKKEVLFLVHIKVDIIARYMERLINYTDDADTNTTEPAGGVSMSTLAAAGFLNRR